MYYGFTIEVYSADHLKCEQWRFVILDQMTVSLDWYHALERPTRRHVFRRKRAWYRIPNLQRNDREAEAIQRPDVPQSILAKAREQINADIKFN